MNDEIERIDTVGKLVDWLISNYEWSERTVINDRSVSMRADSADLERTVAALRAKAKELMGDD